MDNKTKGLLLLGGGIGAFLLFSKSGSSEAVPYFGSAQEIGSGEMNYTDVGKTAPSPALDFAGLNLFPATTQQNPFTAQAPPLNSSKKDYTVTFGNQTQQTFSSSDISVMELGGTVQKGGSNYFALADTSKKSAQIISLTPVASGSGLDTVKAKATSQTTAQKEKEVASLPQWKQDVYYSNKKAISSRK